jgi:hypothetical protein
MGLNLFLSYLGLTICLSIVAFLVRIAIVLIRYKPKDNEDFFRLGRYRNPRR